MKGKSKILGVALSLMLMLSLTAFAVPVSAGTLSWSTVSIPSTTGKVLEECDVVDIGVSDDGETIYAAAPFVSVATLSDTGATWETDYGVSGNSSAELVNAYVEFVPAAGITMADLASGAWSYWYWYDYDAVSGGPNIELRFTMPVGYDPASTTGHVDVNVQAGALGTTLTVNEWAEEDAATNDTMYYYGNDPVDGSPFQWECTDGRKTLADALALIDASANMTGHDASAAAWELTRVRIEMPVERTCYIDDVTIAGITYNLEGAGGSSDPGEALAGNLFKSTNAGESWSGVTLPTGAVNVRFVAVAPANEDIVAIVADNIEVYVSVNGGTTWSDLGVPQETGADPGAICTVINDLAVSPEKGGKYYIAVAGEEGGGTPLANVWYYDVYAASAKWHETNDKDGFNETTNIAATVANTAAAVVFSPNFASDQVMLALIQDDAPSKITLEVYSYNHSKWNVSAGFDGYGVTITDVDNITGITSGSITLDPEYLFSDDAMRLAFIGLNVADDAVAESGIYRADDVAVKAIREGAAYLIHSVAYNGSVLIGGRYDSNVCYYSTDPTATTPTFSTTRSLKRPGMLDADLDEKVVLAWAGDDVVAGTSGASSAFAVSTNDGKSFSDISLIDTALTNMTDVAVSPNGSKVYMATDDGSDFSLWRYASDWQRVLAVPNKDTFIVRLAPDDPSVVYVADKGSTAIYYSADGGMERWQTRTSKYKVEDLAVEGEGDVAYVLVLADGKVSKSTNSGFTWGTSKSSKLSGGNMIVSLGEDKLLVGSDDGYVAYSIDGNSSWTKIGKQLGDSSSEVSAIASGLADEDYIYAGLEVADEIYRWQIGVDTSWYSINDDVDPVYGIALQDGVLYASSANVSGSTTYRTLNPTDSVAPSWSTMPKAVTFDIEPQGLKVGGGKLWAIDSANDKLYSYTDTLADVAPTLTAPKTGLSVKVNPVTGCANDITFSWEKPSTKVTDYQLRFYDADGGNVKNVTVSSTSSTPSQVVGRFIDEAKFTFMPGETYSWKVRVASPTWGPYSEVRTFTVEEAEAAAAVVTVEPAPPAPAPEVTVQPPEVNVTVEAPPTPEAPVAPAIPAYLLWTIIGIGAVLIIALIVLIVRTRRVV